jgi:DDE superfamily endonuclease
MPAPALILAVLDSFRPEFSPQTWARVVTLVLGTITARGRRTVAAALRQMGLHDDPDFSSYHQVFNRAAWSPRRLARRLLRAAIAAFVPRGVGLSFAIDETLERRWGRKIRIRGHYRDPLASSKERSVSAGGIRWIVLALVVNVPWAGRPWALPILILPAPTPKVSQKPGRRHKTIAERARQMIACLRRWLPGLELTVVGDSAYSVIELGLSCRRRDVRLIAPLRLDARLFTPAPPKVPGKVGRPRVAGDRLPNLEVVLADPKTAWTKVKVRWYDGADRELELASGTAVWYHNGIEPLPIRWVLTRDPAAQMEPRAYFSTRPEDEPAEIPAEVVKRRPIEVTFEETRAHLGVETQRQWSDLAIERETPCLFGLYSLVALIGQALHQRSPIAIRTAAWYPKAEASFSDVLAAVRRECWGFLDIRTSQGDPSRAEIPRSQLDRLVNAVCYSH